MALTLPVGLFYLVTCAGLCVGIGSHKTVKVVAGHEAVLPCHLEPPFSETGLTVEWTRDGKKVHFYRSKADNLDDQDKDFKGRTSLFHDEMLRGNLSLKLTKVTELDAGNYTCYVRFKNGSDSPEDRKYYVTLIVDTEPKPESTPSQKISDENPEPIGNAIGGAKLVDVIVIVAVIAGVIVAVAFIAGVIAGVKRKQSRNNRSEAKTDTNSTTGIRYWRGRKRRSSDDNPSDNMQSTSDTSN